MFCKNYIRKSEVQYYNFSFHVYICTCHYMLYVTCENMFCWIAVCGKMSKAPDCAGSLWQFQIIVFIFHKKHDYIVDSYFNHLCEVIQMRHHDIFQPIIKTKFTQLCKISKKVLLKLYYIKNSKIRGKTV